LPAPSELGLDVPAGDPAELRDVARFLRAAAAALEDVTTRVATAASAVGVCWTGPASYFFKVRVGQTVRAIRTAPASCGNAAAALERLASDLEDTRRRALAAEADAVAARQRRDAALYELTAMGSTAFLDPVTHQTLRNRLDDAHRDLAIAKSHGERAQQDSIEAGRRAAAALNQLADAVEVPPPPADPDVRPSETTKQWWHRQLGDILVDPVSTLFRPQEEPRKRVQVAFDVYTGGAGGLIEGVNRHSGYLFQSVRDVRVIPGPVVVRRFWLEQPGQLPLATQMETEQKLGYKVTLGPDSQAGETMAKVAKYAKYGGWTLSGGTAALDQWLDDRERHDLSGGQKISRMAMSMVTVGAGSAIGGSLGFEIGFSGGMIVGSIFPGPGTVIGGIGGGVAGTIYGASIGQAIGDKLKGSLFNFIGMN
jgi:hypothetical protein